MIKKIIENDRHEMYRYARVVTNIACDEGLFFSFFSFFHDTFFY